MSNQNRANKNSFVKAQMKNIARLKNQYNRVQQEITTMNRLNTPQNEKKRKEYENQKKNLKRQMNNAENSIQRFNEQLKKRSMNKARARNENITRPNAQKAIKLAQQQTKNEEKRRNIKLKINKTNNARGLAAAMFSNANEAVAKKEKELKNYEASILRGLSKNLIHSNKELATLQAQISNMESSLKMNNASKKELERMKKRRNTLKKSMSNTTKILEQNKLNTTNIKTIYRDVRTNLNQLLEVLIEALNEKHKAGFMNIRYGGFENQAKKLKKELSKGANNVKDEYTFIGNMTKLFNKIIKFLHKIKPHIEKSLRKDRKGKKAKQDLASRQIGHAYLNIVEYLKSIKLINKNSKSVQIKNLNKNVRNKLENYVIANAKVNHKSKMTNVLKNIKKRSVKKHVNNNEIIPPSLINTEAGKEYYNGLKKHIPLQNKSSAPKHLQLIPTSTNLVPKAKNVNSSIKNLKLQLNLPNGATLPDIIKLMRTTNRTNTNKNTERAKLFILLYKLMQKQKKGIKTTNMGPQELLLLENRPHSNINLPKSVPRANNKKNKRATNIQRIFRGFRNRKKFQEMSKQLNNIAELVDTPKISKEDLETVEKITKKSYNWKKIGMITGGVIVSTISLLALRELLKKKGVSNTDMVVGGAVLLNAVENSGVFGNKNSRNPLIAQTNQPKTVRYIQPLVKEITNELENIDKKQRRGLCQKVTNKVGEYLGNLLGALAKTAEGAIGYRNQHGQLHSQKGLTANLLNQQKLQGNPLLNVPEQKVTFAEVINYYPQNNRQFSYIMNGIPFNQEGKPITKTGGSRTVHIKGVGKRVVRQTKTGRTYVIVNKKKRYLN